ncbi:MAG TPA: EAL domain-containing protein [Acidimicrobiales bacterium]|nr:EAL domain-containing protein [Acidimicrobiales bacterium]
MSVLAEDPKGSVATVGFRGLLPAAVARWIRAGVAYLPRGQSLNEDVWRVRHRTMSYLLRAHVGVVFCFALVRGYSLPSAVMYASIIAVFACLSATDPRRRGFVSAMNALGLVTSSAVLVDLSGGVIEMHFHFFVLVGILTLYQDWLPFLLAIGFVVLHHGVLGVLDPTAVYDHSSAINHPFEWALIHGFFVLAASVTSVVAWKLNEEQAFRDALTHLPNRALFQDRVSHALARANQRPRVLGVLFIDLDGFKDVNDSLGHGAGDQLLCMVAERLRSCLRPADTVARLGGDEFAILVEDIACEDDAAAVAERVLDALATPFVVGGRDTAVGASIGIALNSRVDDLDNLLRSADVAMYSVKQSGRARYQLYTAEMLTSVVDRVQVSQQLRRAVENHELVLHYQPMVDMGTGEIRGVEALIRWAHPTRGLLAPVEFLGVAEQTGAIHAIGEWVLDSACLQVQAWNRKFPESTLRVSVNLSPTQILQSSIVTSVSGALERSGLDPSFLILELTEAVMVQDTDLAAIRLDQLKSLGVRLAIDDFGTGYSSLGYLRALPFDILKIDKGFVDGVTDGSTEPALTRAILTLAGSLGMIAVAEGVEEAEQAQILQEMGCKFAQGYLFARPLPVDQVEALLASATTVPTNQGTLS